MKFIILGRTDSPCCICEKPNARHVAIPEKKFSGALCIQHIDEKTNFPMPVKKKKEKGSAAHNPPSSRTPQ